MARELTRLKNPCGGRVRPPTVARRRSISTARVETEQREALEALRQVIRKAAPDAEEVITYGIPAFRQDGFLLGFAASTKHCSLHPMNSHTVADFAGELAGYSTSTGTIRFTPAKPLPAALVRKIVKARIAENNADAKEKAAMKGKKR